MAMEVWAGIECTVNRVGDVYYDQILKSGHEHRLDDLERFAALGIRALRYPILWERTAPNGLSSASWDWADRRLHRLAELGVRPIVGLVHHGSGPRDTHLLDPDFPSRLAEFGAAVARRYPWVSSYTPVNEPLTTARFSGLYGHWFPHRTDDRAFLRALIIQCQAIRLTMQAIRSATASAQLIQTEDAGLTYSTPTLRYQADFENHRRVLSLDLLTGSVGREHALADYLSRYGIQDHDLSCFSQSVMSSLDIIGLNYYLTGDRLLDERLNRYPSWSHGGNGRHTYADIAAVRAWEPGITGFSSLLTNTWRRYGIPVAVTEAHVGCTREEQLRWLLEAWEGAQAARAQGVDVRAVTAWSLLGAYDWNRMVTVDAGWYEPGVFDLRSLTPRRTALADLIQALTTEGHGRHPVLSGKGWWHRASRFEFPSVGAEDTVSVPTERVVPADMPASFRHPLIVVGAHGTLGHALAKLCEERGLDCLALSRRELDIVDAEEVGRLIAEMRPWAVINAAGYVRVDDAETECDRCLRENTVGAERLAAACQHAGIRFLTYSSDLVFNGVQGAPYLESHPVHPLSVYGRSKAEAERLVSQTMPSSLIIRTSAFFGPWDRSNFVANVLIDLMEGRRVRAGSDIVSPTYVPDLVHASLDLLVDGEQGLWHVANQGAASWSHLAKTLARLYRLNATLVEECHASALGWAATRPEYSALGSERGVLLPPWEDSLERYAHERVEDRGAGRALCN